MRRLRSRDTWDTVIKKCDARILHPSRVCCRANQNSPAVNSSLFIAREALAQKPPGITKAVVWSSGEKMSLASSWHDASLLLSSQASEQEATSLAGLEESSGQVVLAWITGFSLHCPGAGAALLSPAVPGSLFSQHLSAVSAFIFSALTVQSPFWPLPAEAAQGGRGHHGDRAIHTCSPGLLGNS